MGAGTTPSLQPWTSKANDRNITHTGGIDAASRELREIWDFNNPNQLITAEQFGRYKAQHALLKDTLVPNTLEAHKMGGDAVKWDGKIYDAYHKHVRMPSLEVAQAANDLDTEYQAGLIANQSNADANQHNLGQLQRAQEAARQQFESQLSAASAF